MFLCIFQDVNELLCRSSHSVLPAYKVSFIAGTAMGDMLFKAL